MTRFTLLAAIGVLSVTASIVTAPAQMMAPPVVPSGAGLSGAAGIGSHLGATPLGGSGLGVGSAPGGMSLTPTNLTGSATGYSTPVVNFPQAANGATLNSAGASSQAKQTSSTTASTSRPCDPLDAAAEAQAVVARGVAVHPVGGSPPQDKEKDDDDKKGNWWLWLLLVGAVLVINSWMRRTK